MEDILAWIVRASLNLVLIEVYVTVSTHVHSGLICFHEAFYIHAGLTFSFTI